MPLTLSIGLTEAVADDDAVTLIARADKALYQAKADGRNCRRVVIAGAEAAPSTAKPEATPAIADIVLPHSTSLLN
jgi:predicted signal transduction protein with EAL and GGDEF domain